MRAHARQFRVFCGILFGVGIITLLPVTRANAVTGNELLTQFGSQGSGAGQLKAARAIATSPVTGHVFVVDTQNSRIDEFTAWGNFVKAFGWDVAPAGVNEQQEVTIKATAGQFKLSFGASTTVDLEHSAPASEAEGPGSVEVALNALPSISAGGGKVSVAKGPSDGSSSRYLVSFVAGPLKEANVEQLGASGGTTPLSGGMPSSSAVVGTRADGTSGGTGLESCTAESGCKAGNSGTGAGQFIFANGLTVNASGDIYLRDAAEADKRVQKFDPSGRFISMFGGEVNKTTKANICTAASGDECGAGVPGNGPGQFEGGIGIAVGPTNKVFVADKERIQEFEPDGTYLASIPVPGKTIIEFAVDPSSGDFYGTFGVNGFGSQEASLSKLAPSGAELCSLAAPRPGYISIDPAGNVYAAKTSFAIGTESILEFDGNCPAAKVSEFALENVRQKITATATNTAGNLLVGRAEEGVSAFISLYGPAPVKFEPPPAVPPTISAQYAIGVDPEDATVRAEINPHFWTDARYYVEYGTGKCSEGGCEDVQPAPPGALLTAKVSGDPVVSGGVVLQNLEPSTTYHYRFVAKSGGGGPVYGIGGEVGTGGVEGTLRTPPLPEPPQAGCPNQAFRTGPSAALPDCRAYEMVSPVDKSNGDIRDRTNVSGFSVGLRQSTPDGEAITYSSYRSFADPLTGTYSQQYLARRGAGGWSSEGLAHARTGKSVFNSVAATENEFKAFSADLCSLWLVDPSPVTYAAGGLENFPNLYRRENCPTSYEALTTVEPSGALPKEFKPEQLPELQGFSADGTNAIIRMPFKMSDVGVEGHYQAYEAGGGELRLVCILPDGTPLSGGCSAGGGSHQLTFGSSVSHAISEDGSRVYWTANETGPGKIYLRLNGATTVEVSGTATTAKAQFLGATPDGSSALFLPVEKPKMGKLFKYSLEAGESSEIAGEVIGVAGASEDLSYVYFVSTEAIGGEGTAGQPNLFLNHEGTNTFVATLAQADVETNDEGHYSDIDTRPVYHAARATPDGRHLSFISVDPLTGYDNTDVESGRADFEVFQYSADIAELNCVSCNPGGARPQGRAVKAPAGAEVWTAAMIPAGENQLYTPRAQSEDGNRLFFTSYGPLVARDTNGVADVYEWERSGTGGCKEDASAYSPANGGCVYLISGGTDGANSELVDTSADGRDVFIATDESLLAQDPGLIDIYDARVNGGFPPPQSPPAACEGEACQGPLSAPNDPTPASSALEGNGNFREPSKARCPKGKARHKGRCVARHKSAKKHSSHRSAKSKGRSAR